jgi:hypothetical protein
MQLPNTDELKNIPEVVELDRASQSLEIDARTFQVHSPQAFTFAGTKLTDIKGRRKALEELRKSMTRPLDDAKKAILAFFKGPEERLDQAEAAIKRAMLQFQAEEDRKRRTEQARLEEQARKERERLQRQADAAAAKGRDERAAELEQRAATVVAPIVQTAAPKVEGISTRKVWKFEVVNPAEINPTFCVPDETKIGKAVRAMGADAASVIGPGVRIWQEEQLAARSAP